MTSSFRIDPHYPRSIPPARTIVIAGKRNTGKTTLMMDILYHRRSMQFGIAIVGSIGSKVALRDVLPDSFIYDEFVEGELLRFWSEVKVMNGRLHRKGRTMVDAFIILDDTGFDDRLWKNKVMKEMMQNGRQYNLTMIICMQYVKGLTTGMRSQIDYLYVLKEKSPEMQKKIYDIYAGGMFPSKAVWEKVLDECTKKYRTLVLKNSDVNEDEGDFDGNVFFYKAKEKQPEFRIGCVEMWEEHYSEYNEHYESEEEERERELIRGGARVEKPVKKCDIRVTCAKKTKVAKGARGARKRKTRKDKRDGW